MGVENNVIINSETVAFALNLLKGEIVMKQLICGLLMVLTPMILFAVDVIFIVEGFKSNSGAVRVGVYASSETFPNDGNKVTGCVSENKLSGSSVKVVCQLDSGIYAAAAFHDENGNEKLDTNLLGIPKENYGFSNNASGMFGPPDFNDAAFEVGTEDIKLNIQIQ